MKNKPYNLTIFCRYIIFCIVLVSFHDISAQGLLSESPEKKVIQETPELENLAVKWWDYFELAENIKEFNLHSEQLVEHLKQTTSSSKSAKELTPLILDIETLLDQLLKQKFTSTKIANEKSLPLLDSYSLTNLLEMNKETREIEQQIKKNKEEIQSLQQSMDNLRYFLEELKVNYYTIEDNIEGKQKLGLDWISQRIKLALDEIRGTRYKQKSELLNKHLNEKNSRLLLASKKLIMEDDKMSWLDLKSIKSNLKKVEIKINDLSIKLTESAGDKVESRLNKDIIKLDLTLALIESSKYKLYINQEQQTHLLYELFSNKKADISKTREFITHTQFILREMDSSIKDWQRISLQTLLWPITAIDKNPSKKILKLDQLKRQKAQLIIKEYETLKTIKDDNHFIISLLTNKLKDVETGLSKSWYLVKDFIINAKNAVVDFIYKPIITINEYPVTILPLIKLLLIILIGYLVSKTVTFFITRYEVKKKLDRFNNRSSLYLMHRLIHYVIIFIATLSGFSVLGINLGNITLIAGALSVGIGFGLQNLVSNFVSGLTIMFEKTLSVGDYIEIDGQVTGVVKEIRARSTRLNTNDNIDIIIPNSEMVTNKVVNWTLKESIRRVKIPFGVAYGTDKELVKKAALEAAENVQYTLQNQQGKEPDVWMVGFGDNSVDYLLLVWVAHFGLRRPNRIKSYYLWELDTALNKYGIEIPFPQRDVHLNIVKKDNKNPTIDQDIPKHDLDD